MILASDGAFAFNTGASDAGQGNEAIRISPNGNVGLGTNNPNARLQVLNATCDGSSWINASDRGLKENFQALDAREVLAKVARLPISRWSYKAAPGQEHIGPVAQDFAAAFNVGPDDKHIATVDANGVALAAIQGLNQVLGEQKEQLQQRDLEIQALKESFFELQRLVLKLTSSQTAQEGQ